MKESAMELRTLSVKGMVCKRCIMTVEAELQRRGYMPVELSLGEVSFLSDEASEAADLAAGLSLLGFQVLEDPKVQIVKAVKLLVGEVYSGNFDFPDRFRFSALVKERFRQSYDTVSDAFAAAENKTIEKYITDFRIGKVREMLVYEDISLADIAFRLNFSSAAYLSAHFKQFTGLTPSYFKKVKKEKSDMFASNR